MFDAENFKSQLQFLTEENFEKNALELYKYQYENNAIYREYAQLTKKTPDQTKKLEDIPFLPIDFFKNHQIKTGKWETQKIYMSSGTTGMARSRHEIKDVGFYLNYAKITFERFFGSLKNTLLIALLPSYQEQGHSSLIAMIDYFMKHTQEGSGYFLNQPDSILKAIEQNRDKKICLFGVTYALLELSENAQITHPDLHIFETGGMKGRRKEITREELHDYLDKRHQPRSIYSEYGMTELLSQGYSVRSKFKFPEWAKILVRDINDPFQYIENGKTGGINVIDLANVDSCAFIETKDLGRRSTDESFEVLGRFDNSDIRGCNLLIQ